MKKILLLALVICISVFANSQVIVPKGKKILGGSFGFSSIHNDVDSTNPSMGNLNQYVFAISPSLGFTTKNNSVWGVLLFTQFGKFETTSPNSNLVQEGSSFMVGPGVFYEKFVALGKNFHLSAMSSLRFTYGNQENKAYTNGFVYNDSEVKTKSASLALTPYLGYSLNNKWMVQASIGEILNLSYSDNELTTKSSSSPERKSEYSSFTINSRLNRGFRLGALAMTLRYSF